MKKESVWTLFFALNSKIPNSEIENSKKNLHICDFFTNFACKII